MRRLFISQIKGIFPFINNISNLFYQIYLLLIIFVIAMEQKMNQTFFSQYRNSTGNQLFLQFKTPNYLQANKSQIQKINANNINVNTKTIENKIEKYQLIFSNKKLQQKKQIAKKHQVNVQKKGFLNQIKTRLKTQEAISKQSLKQKPFFTFSKLTHAQLQLRSSESIARKFDLSTQRLQLNKNKSKKQSLKTILKTQQNNTASQKEIQQVQKNSLKYVQQKNPQQEVIKFDSYFQEQIEQKKKIKNIHIEKNILKDPNQKNIYYFEDLYNKKQIVKNVIPTISSPRNKQIQTIRLKTKNSQDDKKIDCTSLKLQLQCLKKTSQKQKLESFRQKYNINSPSIQTKLFKTFTTLDQLWGQQKNKATQIIFTKKPLNQFSLGRVLGQGKFGKVLLCRDRFTGFMMAAKKISKTKVLQHKLQEQIRNQVKIHSRLQHINIINCYGFFWDKNDIYLLLQYLNGGTLFEYLNEMQTLSVKETVDFLRQIISAVTYLHNHSIVHRDIKPENIILSQGLAKLCDFGWSAVVDEPRKTFCGTQDYVCPEILERKEYGMAADIWCIGMLTYQLLAGRTPFQGNQKQINYQITHVDKIVLQYPYNFPEEAIQFIQALLQKDPENRPKCHQLTKFKLFTMQPSKNNKKK